MIVQVLLYVGVSTNALARIAGDKKSEWVRKIAGVEVEHFPDLKAAKAAERKAIFTEKQAYNKQRIAERGNLLPD